MTQPGLEPRPLVPKSSVLTIRLLGLPQHDHNLSLIVYICLSGKKVSSYDGSERAAAAKLILYNLTNLQSSLNRSRAKFHFFHSSYFTRLILPKLPSTSEVSSVT